MRTKKSKSLGILGMIFMLVVLTVFSSCKKEEVDGDEENEEDPETTLSVSPVSLDFDAGGGSKALYITSNSSWTISGLADWITPVVVASEGNATITVTVDEYDGDEDRSKTIGITAGDITRNVDISQSAIHLTVSPESFDFEPGGGSGELTITSNTDWTISTSSDWVIPSVESSQGDHTVAFTVETNESILKRTATITISANTIVHEIQVHQGAVQEYEIPPDNTGMRDLNSVQMTQELKIGWNVGNSLDAIGGETEWGNPLITQRLMDSVADAGFNTVRIPVAWSKFSDPSNYIIEESWKNRVEEVVNYVLNSGMYAIINIHWDGGWIQPTYEDEEEVTNRLITMWTQIAKHFRDYDDRLLFAGTNEVMVEDDYSRPTKEYYTVQNGYNQAFVTAVRLSGGRNVHRHLIVQGFNTNIDYTVDYAEMPEDFVEERLMMEVHYYDPYQFTLDENSTVSQWGDDAEDPSKTAEWANESYADDQFNKMKTNFVDQGIGVILGEYGTIIKTDLGDEDNEKYAMYREEYTEYVTQSMVDHGLVPIYWDNGHDGNHGMAIFDRDNGTQLFPNLVNAIISAVEE